MNLYEIEWQTDRLIGELYIVVSDEDAALAMARAWCLRAGPMQRAKCTVVRVVEPCVIIPSTMRWKEI